MQKSEENLETLQVAAEWNNINKNQSLMKMKPVVPGKNAKNWENCETLQLAASATAWTKINVWWRSVVLQKNAKKVRNFETLQLTVECHSINKNQRFIKIKPVVPKNNAKNWETLQLAAECNSMNKINVWWRPVVPEKYAKSEENFETLQLTVECHSMNKNQSLKKIRPVVP